jgi:hypothetical protein
MLAPLPVNTLAYHPSSCVAVLLIVYSWCMILVRRVAVLVHVSLAPCPGCCCESKEYVDHSPSQVSNVKWTFFSLIPVPEFLLLCYELSSYSFSILHFYFRRALLAWQSRTKAKLAIWRGPFPAPSSCTWSSTLHAGVKSNAAEEALKSTPSHLLEEDKDYEVELCAWRRQLGRKVMGALARWRSVCEGIDCMNLTLQTLFKFILLYIFCGQIHCIRVVLPIMNTSSKALILCASELQKNSYTFQHRRKRQDLQLKGQAHYNRSAMRRCALNTNCCFNLWN